MRGYRYPDLKKMTLPAEKRYNKQTTNEPAPPPKKDQDRSVRTQTIELLSCPQPTILFILNPNEFSAELGEELLLSKMAQAMGLSLKQDAGIIFWQDQPKEILFEKVNVLNPGCVIIMGQDPTRRLFSLKAKFTTIRGLWLDLHTPEPKKALATWSPKELIKEPQRKRQTWSDLKKVMGELNL